MRKTDLMALFLDQPENDGALDGKKAGKLRIEEDQLLRMVSPFVEEAEPVATWADVREVWIVRDDRDSCELVALADARGLTVRWM